MKQILVALSFGSGRSWLALLLLGCSSLWVSGAPAVLAVPPMPAEGQLEAPAGGLRFTTPRQEIESTNATEPIACVFGFENTSAETVTVKACQSSCSSCATAQVEPQVVPPGGRGWVLLRVAASRRGGTRNYPVHLLTEESGGLHQYELELRLRRPTGLPNAARTAARLAKRPGAGLTEATAAGTWRLSSLEVWFDTWPGESAELDQREREKIQNQDFPVGLTQLELKADRTFQLQAGRHLAVGQWTVEEKRLPLHIQRPGCANSTCAKTWPLEIVTTEPNRLVVDLPDEDEGSPRMVRLEFVRQNLAGRNQRRVEAL